MAIIGELREIVDERPQAFALATVMIARVMFQR